MIQDENTRAEEDTTVHQHPGCGRRSPRLFRAVTTKTTMMAPPPPSPVRRTVPSLPKKRKIETTTKPKKKNKSNTNEHVITEGDVDGGDICSEEFETSCSSINHEDNDGSDADDVHQDQDQTNMERFIRLSRTFRTLSREERVKELQISGRIIKQEIQRWLNQAEYFGNQLEDPQQLQTLYDQVSDTLLQQGRIPPPQSQQQRTDRQEQQKAPE